MLALIIFVLKWLEYRFILIDRTIDVYVGFIALIFTLIGIWLALTLAKPKVLVETRVIEKAPEPQNVAQFMVNTNELARLEISKRELEVLALMSKGLSNQEIAENLFVSLNTVKTHASNLYSKLDVKRRTQAIEKAKALRLIS